MAGERAVQWVEAYLSSARDHRAREESVFAEGERRGFSERKVRRAAASLDIVTASGSWELPDLRTQPLSPDAVLGHVRREKAQRPAAPAVPGTGVPRPRYHAA